MILKNLLWNFQLTSQYNNAQLIAFNFLMKEILQMQFKQQREINYNLKIGKIFNYFQH